MGKLRIASEVGVCQKKAVLRSTDPIHLSEVFLENKNASVITKNISDLKLNDFITFNVVSGEVLAKLFGVFKPIPNDYFILADCPIIEDVPKGFVYQVQKRADGNLFLQGIRNGFTYKV